MTKRDTLYLHLGIAYACCFLLRGAAVAKRYKQIEAYAREHPPLEDTMKPIFKYTTNLSVTIRDTPTPLELVKVIEFLARSRDFVFTKNSVDRQPKSEKKYPWHKVQGHRAPKKRA